MLLIKHDSGAYYTPGVGYGVKQEGSEATVDAYDRDERLIKTHTFKTDEIEVIVL